MALLRNSDGSHTLFAPLLFGLMLGGLAFTLTTAPVSLALTSWANDNQPSTAFSEPDNEPNEPVEQKTSPMPQLLVNGQPIPVSNDGEIKQELMSDGGKTSIHVFSSRTGNGSTSTHSTNIHISSNQAGASNEIRYEE